MEKNYTNTVVIGGGQAGLAMSRCLVSEGVAHVVLESARIAERWHRCGWESLRLLTPNWQSRLPGGWRYQGEEPDGFMTPAELVEYLENYAKSFDAPVLTQTKVVSVEKLTDGGFCVVTNQESVWMCKNVVVATGHCDVPLIPKVASGLTASDVVQLHSSDYKRAKDLPPGNVLVVGAGASGVQIAEEIAKAGRKVTLSVGTHSRLPRTYRDKDTLWWVDAMGGFTAPSDQEMEARFPGPQLTGGLPPHTIDLNELQRLGVRLVGKVTNMEGSLVTFDEGLKDRVEKADKDMLALLAKIDEFASKQSLIDDVPLDPQDENALLPTRLCPMVTKLDLAEQDICTIVWATGFRRSYPFLKIPSVIKSNGDVRNQGGVTDEPGLYVLGLRWMRRKNSQFVDGVGLDAADLTRHLARRNQGIDCDPSRQ